MRIAGKTVEYPVDKALIDSDLDRPICSISGISARDFCSLFEAEGINTYIMGGAVRDWIVGRSARDIDIMVDVSLGRVLDVIAPITKNLKLDAKPHYGLMYAKGDLGDVDLNSMRDCDDIGESKDVDDVFFRPGSSLTKDAPHRDFSFNSFYYCYSDQNIINHFPDSLDDLLSGTLRLITDERKLNVDYRVTIRILQFMARGYTPTAATIDVLRRKLAQDIMKTPKYRTWMDVHVPPGSVDRERFESLALEYVDDAHARDRLADWFADAH
jgi:poly(A) polymerase